MVVAVVVVERSAVAMVGVRAAVMRGAVAGKVGDLVAGTVVVTMVRVTAVVVRGVALTAEAI